MSNPPQLDASDAADSEAGAPATRGSVTTVPTDMVPPAPAPADPSLLEIGRTRLAALRALLERHRADSADPDVEFVHDVRVLTRRLSEVVGVLDELIDPAVGEAIDETLRQTRRSAGALRDLDVLGEHLARWRFPAGLRPLRKRLLGEMPERRATLVLPLRLQLAGSALGEALLVLARVLENPAHAQSAFAERLAGVLKKRLRRRQKQLRQAFGKAALKQTSTALHQARIAAKKYRYALELADESGLQAGGRNLKFLKRVQKHLGDMHDTDVILQTLGQHVQEVPDATAAQRRHVASAWRSFGKQMGAVQARRAADFFASSYAWMNQEGGGKKGTEAQRH
jgi:CHAD domain-containing protein